ncbi:MAG: TRAP transporter substrate-binding protein DctP [Paracoccaceae bacterium]|nr:TRAP transporter substrate-binding protein DctP [Paracoccaceae bacterium]
MKFFEILKINFRVGLCTLLLACFSFSLNAAEYTGRLSMHWNDKHHCTKHAQMFVDEVFKQSNGRLKIEVFHSGQLFGIREIMGGITSGAVDLGGVVGVVGFPKINKNFNVATIPGLFDSFEQQRKFFQRSDKGSEIWNDLLKKTNSTLVMYNPVGPVMTFSGARELTGVDAMKDLKARRLIGAEEPMWKAYGAKIVGLKTSEVYTALQTGMIDTINTPPQSIRAYSWWEFLKFGQKPYQYFADAYIMANSDWFNKLPNDLQKIVSEAGKKFGDVSTNKIIGVGEEVISEFEARGGKMTVLTGAEKDKFDKLMSEKVLPAMMDKFDADALKAAEAFVKK